MHKLKIDPVNYSWVDSELKWDPLPVPEMPPRVLLDLATKCNLRCPMCTVWGSGDDLAIDEVKGVMSLEKSRKLLDEMMSSKPLIQPNMYGEPLLAPYLKEQIHDMKLRGMSVALNTNGLTLKDEMANFFVDAEVDSVMFSIDAVTKETLLKIRGVDKLSKLENAVFKMLKIRGNRIKPRIGVSFTTQNENRHEKEDFVKRWVGVVDVVRVGVLFENGTFPDMEAPLKRVPCPALYNTIPIHNDGVATICCLDGFKETEIGNVFDDGIKEVWHGEAFSKIRYYHETGQFDKVPFCKNCNGWAQYDFEEKVEDGILIRSSPQYTYYNKIEALVNWSGSLLGGHSDPAKVIKPNS